jgi:hypothetical protein
MDVYSFGLLLVLVSGEKGAVKLVDKAKKIKNCGHIIQSST